MTLFDRNNIEKGSYKAWVIVISAAIFYSYQFILRVSPNIMHEDITNNFSIDNSSFGLIVGIYYWGYSLMQIPMGVIMDRIGPKKILTTACFAIAVANLIFAYTNNIYVAGFARLIIGVSAATGLMGSLKFGSMWLDPSKISIITAITIGFGTIGASIGGRPLRAMLDYFGWIQTHNILSYIGIGLGIVFLFVLVEPKKVLRPKITKHKVFDGLLCVLRNPQSWLIAIFGALMYMPITIMGMAWGIPFLKSVYNISGLEVAPITTSMFLGAAIGGPFFAFVSESLNSRKKPMLLGGIISLILWLIIIRVPNLKIVYMYPLFFFAGFFYTTKILTFASNCELHSPDISAVVTAFNSMIVMVMGAVSHPLVGLIIKFMGSDIVSSSDYRNALTIIPIFISSSMVLLYFMKETYTNVKK